MDIETRKLAYKLATTSCETLGIIATGEKILSLVEAIYPVLESGLTPRAVDVAKSASEKTVVAKFESGKLVSERVISPRN